MAGTRAGIGPLCGVVAAVTWNLWEFRAAALPAQYLNDSSVHEQMVRFAAARISAGHDPLASWFPYLGLGSPQFMHYQGTPAILTALAGLVIGPDAAFRWSLYLLWCLWPVAIYCSARLLRLDRRCAAAAAVVAPLLHSVPGIGYEQHAYLWTGFGVWTQLWGSWALPFAWALTWRAVADKRFIAPAAALVALTCAFHFETGYLAFLAILVTPFLCWQDLGRRVIRGFAVLAVALLASAWVVVPLLRYSRWAAVNQALQGTPQVNGYGAGRTLGWLVTGNVFDAGHLPVVTLLVAAGLIAAATRWRDGGPQRTLVALLGAALVLSFGRTTFGHLIGIIPGSTDIFFRRFLMGAQLAGIYLAGIGAVAVAESAARVARARLVPPVAAAAAIALVSAAYLYPAWHYLAVRDAVTSQVSIEQWYAQARGPMAAAVAAAQAAIRRDGPGRVYAGMVSGGLRHLPVGYVPMYAYTESLDLDEVGYTLRTASLMTQPEYLFDPGDPGDYALFGVRYLIRPPHGRPPPGAVLILARPRLRLYELAANSYFSVGDLIGTISANRADIATRSDAYLHSALPGQRKYLLVRYPGTAPGRAAVALARRTLATASEPAGIVTAEHADLPDGFARATVRVSRRAVVVLSASFDPGWSVTVDGHPGAVQMVAPALAAVIVPPGTHRITFRYTGFGGYPVLLCLAAAALLLATATTGGRTHRRTTGLTHEQASEIPKEFT